MIFRVSRAAVKSAASKVRRAGFLEQRVDWAARAIICEQCPLRVVHKKISYCGKPFVQQINRDETLDGCGCPVRAKAMDPAEHCPIDRRHRSASHDEQGCTCKWCRREQTLARAGGLSSASA